MKYKIFGDKLPAVSLQFEANEAIYTQSGGMTWMTDNFRMETNVRGGLMKGLGRMLSGESLFMATYTAVAGGAEMTLASSFPGAIIALELDGSMEYIAQKSAFLCATPGIELSTYVTKLKAGIFGGEGFVMQRLAGGESSSSSSMEPLLRKISLLVNASRSTPAILPCLNPGFSMTSKLSKDLPMFSLVVRVYSSVPFRVPEKSGCSQ